MFERTKWGEIVQLRYGKALSDYRGDTDATVPVYGTNGPVGFTRTPQVNRPGVIVGRKGAYRGVHYSAEPFSVIDTAFYIDSGPEVIDRWAYYALQLADINGLDSGSAIPSTTRESFYALPVLLPPLAVQEAIVEVLGALDDKIAANTQLAATADDLLATKFESIVGATSKMVRLSEIADVNRSTVKPSPDGQLRYIDIASVEVGSYKFPSATPWAEAPSRARRGICKGDTLWSTVRPNRRSHALNLSDDPLLVGSTGLAVLTPSTVGWAYLYEVTRRPEFTSYLETVADGSAYPAVRADKFGDSLVPLTDEANQRSFEQLAEPLREELHSLGQENQTLAATRDTLLPQLMSGKLRVKEAKKVLENAGV